MLQERHGVSALEEELLPTTLLGSPHKAQVSFVCVCACVSVGVADRLRQGVKFTHNVRYIVSFMGAALLKTS